MGISNRMELPGTRGTTASNGKLQIDWGKANCSVIRLRRAAPRDCGKSLLRHHLLNISVSFLLCLEYNDPKIHTLCDTSYQGNEQSRWASFFEPVPDLLRHVNTWCQKIELPWYLVRTLKLNAWSWWSWRSVYAGTGIWHFDSISMTTPSHKSNVRLL